MTFQEFFIPQIAGFEFNAAKKDVLVYVCLSIATIGVLVFWFTRKLKVNCWFCSVDSYIRRKEVKWWFCTNCEQHNGFSENGDYAKEISEMYEQPRETTLYCRYADENPLKSEEKYTLCEVCQQNQKRKIEELKGFVPTNEAYYAMECEDYERYLRKKYALCVSCSTVAFYQIQQQDKQIKEMYSAEWERLKPEPLRKLKPASFGQSYCWLPSFVNIVSSIGLVAIPLLLKNSLQQDIHDEDQTLILSVCTLLALVFSTPLFSGQGNVSWFQSLSIFRWVAVIFLFNSEWNEYLPFTLNMLLLVEVACLICRVFGHFRQLWRRKRYLDERKRTIARITPTSRKSRIKPIEKETEDLSDMKEPLVDSMPPVQQSSLLFQGNPGIKERRSIVTPDLLQGHLGNMFIEKRDVVAGDIPPRHSTVNHVVAALKYRSNPISSAKQPLLKPATFTLSSNTNIMQRATIYTGDFTAQRKQNIVERQQIGERNNNNFRRSDTTDLLTSASKDMEGTQDGNIGIQTRSRCAVMSSSNSWKLMQILLFSFSLFLNVGLIVFYFLYLKKDDLLISNN